MIYRKRGTAARWENGRLVLSSEAGEAEERDGTFLVRPWRGAPAMDEVDAREVEQTAERIQRVIGSSATIERLIVSAGIAEHELGSARWADETLRIHLALTRPGTRVLYDASDFDAVEVERIAHALSRAGVEREAPLGIRLAPNVTAALLPALTRISPPNVTLLQRPGGIDGHGERVEKQRPVSPPWPNWYRPSYRMRPVRMPFNLAVECSVTEIDQGLPEAVAILEPVTADVMRVLIDEGRHAFPATVRVTRIDAVASEARWYPYAAGAWGSEMQL